VDERHAIGHSLVKFVAEGILDQSQFVTLLAAFEQSLGEPICLSETWVHITWFGNAIRNEMG
jgi:hypothetical protein